jgi:hypothetical protein
MSQSKKTVASSQYHVKSPWDPPTQDLTNDFEKSLNAMNAVVSAPWEETSMDARNNEDRIRQAEGYKFHSMFEVPPPTPAELAKVENYKYIPPYRTSFNQGN